MSKFSAQVLAETADKEVFGKELCEVYVEDYNDGGMGSLMFVSDRTDRKLGADIAQLRFSDTDGIEILATLSLDNYGDPYELDVWKVDFSPVKKLPC